MTTKELVNLLGLELIFDNNVDRAVENCYVGDLLSRVMGNAEPESIWITIMSNVNVAAVAALADVSLVILAESVEPDKELYDKILNSDTLFTKSSYSSYELAWRIREITNI